MKKNVTEKPKPVNFVVLLDLSDRILTEGIIETDKELILSTFNIFEKQARNRNITINSSDKFSIKILPQSGSNFSIKRMENSLYIDMAMTDIAKKNINLIQFEKSLKTKLDSLYFFAFRGNNTKNYPGCDIWKYFNEQLKQDLDTACQNIVIVLTDGYFDFENSNHKLQKGNLLSSSDFYNHLSGSDWKDKAIKHKYGLIPLSFEISFYCIVAGINPKKNNLTEQDKLIYFWSEWMKNSHIPSFYVIPYSVSEKMKSLLLKQINEII